MCSIRNLLSMDSQREHHVSEIIVAPYNDRWAAFINGRPVVKSLCKACVIQALSIFIQKSDIYSTIVIKDQTGNITETIQIGAT